MRITKYKNIFSKIYTKNWSREIFIINSVLKANHWTYKIKDLNGEKIISSFYEDELLRSILQMSYYHLYIIYHLYHYQTVILEIKLKY